MSDTAEHTVEAPAEAPAAEAAAAPAIDTFLDAIRAGDVRTCAAWADRVTLDATVPNWRFSRHGVAEVRDEYARWFAHPATFETMRRLPIDDGEVVEYTINWEEQGIPHAAHHVHVLRLVGNKIAEDMVLCGGRWPASLLAEMEAAKHHG